MPNGTLVETHIDNLVVNGNTDTSGNAIGGYLSVLGDVIDLGAPLPPGHTYQNSTGLGGANTRQSGDRLTTGIISDGATAKNVLNVLIPNFAQSFVCSLTMRVGITTASHTYDSTRVGTFLLIVTRVAGALAVGTLVTLSNAGGNIATSSAGQTFTFTLAAGAVTGANTATQTLPLNITVTGSVTGTADCQIFFSGINATGTPANLNLAAPTGVTVV
jgi:hypothetical protein